MPAFGLLSVVAAAAAFISSNSNAHVAAIPRHNGYQHGRPGWGHNHAHYGTASGSYPYAAPTGTGTAPLSTGTATPGNVTYDFPETIRGVNLGGWLILEKWMNSSLFDGTDASDQYTFDQTSDANTKLRNHWDTYICEDDFRQIAALGINTVRIPIGYWAYDPDSSPYLTGADKYMEKALDWARKYDLKVLVDLHGSPGSQNGFDNSGKSGEVNWQSGDNMKKSISILEIMAKKYGSMDYADVVWGLELVNEPLSWNPNNFTLNKEWAQEATDAVRAKAANRNLMVIMHDSFVNPKQWIKTGEALNGNATAETARFGMDRHLYQNQEDSDSELNQDQHIEKACKWANTDLLGRDNKLPVIVGEFSAATNICAYPDYTTSAGDSCTVEGCQCSCNVWIEQWDQPLVQATRKFVEAQLDAFERGSKGWFMWSWKGPGAWGLQNAAKYGLIGEKVTDRKYPDQCHNYF
ncbi:glycoside hydrolase [Hortaea werneckii]|nr:glycoside hydrolase [Hortaea werneckii]